MVRFSESLMIIERRSTPMRTLSLAFSKSSISTNFLLWRAARSAAQPGPAVSAHRVDLVHEDDAGRVLLALLEEVTHAGGADPDEHLHEVRSRDREERHVGLARDGLGEQRLARARRADQQHALG